MSARVVYAGEHITRLRVMAAKMPLAEPGSEKHTDALWLYAAADCFERLLKAYQRDHDTATEILLEEETRRTRSENAALVIAGLLSTIDTRPSEQHPIEMLPMAERIIEILEGAP